MLRLYTNVIVGEFLTAAVDKVLEVLPVICYVKNNNISFLVHFRQNNLNLSFISISANNIFSS